MKKNGILFRVASGLLAAALTLSLTACGGSGTAGNTLQSIQFLLITCIIFFLGSCRHHLRHQTDRTDLTTASTAQTCSLLLLCLSHRIFFQNSQSVVTLIHCC